MTPPFLFLMILCLSGPNGQSDAHPVGLRSGGQPEPRVSTTAGDTLYLGWEQWGTSEQGQNYWAAYANGRIDVLDLLHFRDPYFEEVTGSAGIAAGHHAIEDYFAIGQAWGDYDGDGFPDLYLTDSNGPNSLWHNQGDGSFALAAINAEVTLAGAASAGAVFADYDNDGWRDLYVLNFGANTLFKNMDGTGFVDVTASAGVGDTAKGQTGSWGDFNKDGYLDLYVTNWGEPGTFEDRFYRNNGDGSFTDITLTLGPRTEGAGFVASWLDFDNDNDLDIYLVNDKLLGNVLWRNDDPTCASGCFSEISTQAGADIQVFGMGLAIADMDGDLDLDLYFSNIGPMVLLENQTSQGNPVFVETGNAAGVAFDCIGWGNVFFDFDNDGWQDLYLAVMNAQPVLANRLYKNLGDGTFQDLSYKAGTANIGPSLGVAYADYDRDGHVDLVIGNLGKGYVLYRNRGIAASDRHWLQLRFEGGGPINRDAIGTRAYLYLSDGRTLMQEVKTGSSLGAGNDMDLHFGLGDSTVTGMDIRWPDGTLQTLSGPAVDQFLTIHYPIR